MNNKKSKDVLVIDGQVFQTPAWHRGMGKYSLNLIQSLLISPKVKMYDRVVIILNSNLHMEKKHREELEKLTKDVKIVELDLAVAKNVKIVEVQPINKKILQKYIDDNFKEEITVHFLILCLFLGETTCIAFPDRAKKLLLFYDLIPFLYFKRYIKRIPFEDYLANFKTVFEADLILSISQTVADDLAIYLGIPHKKIKNINGAAIDRSKIKAVKPKININKKYILMPSGDELRKNNLRAVEGFSKFNAMHDGNYILILTSFFGEETERDLNSISDNLIFTGNIKETELQWLYENAELILFASEYEGLGLPVLEAMTVDKKIACSNIPVFKEISKNAFYYFDHNKPTSIAEGINRALNDKNFENKRINYESLLKRYTWKESSESFYSSLSSLQIDSEEYKKPKIAIFTPHPEGFSAIGKVVSESHSTMSELFEIDYYFDYGLYHHEVRPNFLSYIANSYHASEFNARRYAEYDSVIYHIGNSDYHLETIKNALYLPGITILHDTYLDGAYERLDIDGYMPKGRIKLEKLLNNQVKPQRSRYLTSIINSQIGIICHSNYSAESIDQILADKSIFIERVELPVSVPDIIKNKGYDEKLNICFAGIFADVKGLGIIENIARSLGSDGVEISIFGYDFAQPESINRLKKLSNVQIIANPTDFEFQTLLSKQDVLVNYRLEYKGETSLTTLEAMRYGVVPILRNIGWYSELPDSAVIKLDKQDSVMETIQELFHNRDKLRKTSEQSKRVAQEQFSHEAYSSKIYEIIKSKETNSFNKILSDDIKKGMPLKDLLKEF